AVKRDFPQALVWYRRAADHGSAMAENQLGYFAEEGWGEPQDYNEALSWYTKAAEHGNDAAQENIGFMFQHGTGVPTDYAKALYWFYKAAAQGNGDAENQLGWMFQYGQGVKQDDDKALAWYRLAADQGSIHGRNNLQAFCDELEDSGDERCESGSASIPDAAIAQAQRRARMLDLRARIDGLEADAQKQDNEVSDLEHMSKGKKDAISKVFDAIGTTVSVSPRVQALKDRDEAARLREELARLESEERVAASAPMP
ncbi:MAG TPA: tetratricopeptide repeat protein, partial [Candidatus Acidoferrum sp.]